MFSGSYRILSAAPHGEERLSIAGSLACGGYLRRLITISATVTPTTAMGKNSR